MWCAHVLWGGGGKANAWHTSQQSKVFGQLLDLNLVHRSSGANEWSWPDSWLWIIEPVGSPGCRDNWSLASSVIRFCWVAQLCLCEKRHFRQFWWLLTPDRGSLKISLLDGRWVTGDLDSEAPRSEQWPCLLVRLWAEYEQYESLLLTMAIWAKIILQMVTIFLFLEMI